ncbi:galectin-3-binding protein [Carlito syrichta]|uniref:Galectin-3-binding protein n=1 Tax=Carlito syrichta TaxID=1868482 RepID=A0A1U7T0Q5_CARSF|nr:galectin-3-binding protein [Carlito syrichta]
MALPWLFWMWLLVTGTQGMNDGDMRLADGGASYQGRVEIFYRGQWGTVCDNLWDLTDASVVCRALGFENATEALGRAAFGQGSGPIMLDEVQCTGAEPSLANCTSLGWLKSNCRHEKDAGVVCANETRSSHTLDLSGELSAALGQIFDSQQGCDLSIKVRAQEEDVLGLCGHTLILTTNPEAQALWKKPGSSITMNVDAECVPMVRDFLRYFYSRRIDISLSSVKCFHKLASAYEAKQLQRYCASLFAILLPQDASFQTSLDLYAYALATGDSLLEELCVRFLAWNFEALTQAEAWPSVPTSLLQQLLGRSELAVPSELALLKAVDTWSWEEWASHEETAGLVEKVRFPMMRPEELFELQFNLSLYQSHEALFQKKILQALEFHTVPFQLLAQYRGLNLTEDTYKPRIYTSPTWSASVTAGSRSVPQLVYQPRQRASLVKSAYSPSSYKYNPYQSFQTPPHPSFLFQAKSVSWSLVYLPTVQSCWNYGFSCSSDELPILGLTKSDYSDPTITYENKALMLCGERFVADVTNFEGPKAAIPSALDTNGSRSASFFPCPAGSFSGFRAVIRPFYLTNSTGDDEAAWPRG